MLCMLCMRCVNSTCAACASPACRTAARWGTWCFRPGPTDPVRPPFVGVHLCDVNPCLLPRLHTSSAAHTTNTLCPHPLAPPPPPTTADEFVRIMREALEGDHVSHHLHAWIDLVFGFKQRGEHTKRASRSAINRGALGVGGGINRVSAN